MLRITWRGNPPIIFCGCIPHSRIVEGSNVATFVGNLLPNLQPVLPQSQMFFQNIQGILPLQLVPKTVDWVSFF